ncbi:GDP-mannose 4,6-dehydratase [Fodinisporobacter ferrooxydans]|uniref:GDP-mannose 4,6-dehydratase n=1 Tax=Fodinisporobacter ferrooxydans TaxID=2901836 RepID=A0ABY4CI58_9BACL|nr:GDP-mannose 4,6-dehydratase [Alicyclobacillaceae bacterium MYW30-H2]
MTTRVLITGVNGFVGTHMCNYLLNKNIQVLGTGRSDSCKIKHKNLQYVKCDLLDSSSVKLLVEMNSFESIIHAAGENNASQSWNDPQMTVKTNAIGTLHLLDALRKKPKAHLKNIVVVSSSHEYGKMETTDKISETFLTVPASPYGWSKYLQTSIAEMYAKSYGFPIVIARTFNLIGPGSQGVCAQFARQVAQIENGLQSPLLMVGNTTVSRDFLDVRDAVEAYWKLLNMHLPAPGEVFNICRGTSYQISEIANKFHKISQTPFAVMVDPKLYSNNEPLTITGNNEKLCNMIDWIPKIELEVSIRDMLLEWRSLTNASRKAGEKN